MTETGQIRHTAEIAGGGKNNPQAPSEKIVLLSLVLSDWKRNSLRYAFISLVLTDSRLRVGVCKQEQYYFVDCWWFDGSIVES